MKLIAFKMNDTFYLKYNSTASVLINETYLSTTLEENAFIFLFIPLHYV